MARIVEDSDDEFPDLAQLMRNARVSDSATAVSRDDVGKGNGKNKDASEAKPRRTAVTKSAKGKLTSGGAREDRDVELEAVVQTEKEKAPRPKKRVLNNKNDNPLLRPLSLSSSTTRRISPDLDALDGSMKAKAKETKRRIPKTSELGSGKNSVEPEDQPKKTKNPRQQQKGTLLLKPLKAELPNLEFEEKDHDSDCFTEDDTKKVSRNLEPKLNPAGSEETLKQDLAVVKGKDTKRPLATRTKQKLRKYESDTEEEDESDGLSDFIVNDSTFLDDGESVIEIPVPKSVRRLVRGRRPRAEESEDDDLDFKMEKLKVEDDSISGAREKSWEQDLKEFADSYQEDDSVPILKLLTKSIEKSQRELSKPENNRQTTSRPTTSSSEIDNPFTLKFSPPARPRATSKETRFATPPNSPPLSPSKPRGLISPSKKTPRIPATPHRPSMDAFWAQDVINDWNDAYSPAKPPSPSRPKVNPLISPIKDKAAKQAKKTFESQKVELATTFLAELDEAITGSMIAELAASTGGVKIVWSNKLNTTAGRANWKRETIRKTVPSSTVGEEPKVTITHRHHASIELASKVIDNRSRLLNVIAHEYCHLANFMISNIKTNPHGKEFKIWARKVTLWGQAKGLCAGDGACDGDEGFEVTTKHSYEIEYKFIWECASCGVLYKRHSKSVDPTRHQCGTCKGKLVQVKPVPRGGSAKAAGTEAGAGVAGKQETGRTLTEYQLFVKENMKRVKSENPSSPQKDIMGLVGKQYREMKAARGVAGVVGDSKGVSSVAVEEVEVSGSKESTPGCDTLDDELGGVVRKLDFLDLTGDSN